MRRWCATTVRALRAGLSRVSALAVSLAPCAHVWAQDDPLEHAVKAAYLTKFAPFVEWPDSAFATPSGPLVICVVGESPFRGLLDRAARNQRAHGRAMQVRHLERVTQESGCHIVFASGSSRQSIAEVLDAVRESPVLTVTDNQRRGGRAGIIDFVLQDDRVQFSIDDEAAAAHDLRISSRLLSLAVSVNPRLG